MLHIALHFVVPLTIAVVCWQRQWLYPWLWMLSAMIIDLDHLLADPIYDASRCSIGFHPLHSAVAMFVYAALFLCCVQWSAVPGWPLKFKPGVWFYRAGLFLSGVGIHLILDALDCIF